MRGGLPFSLGDQRRDPNLENCSHGFQTLHPTLRKDRDLLLSCSLTGNLLEGAFIGLFPKLGS